MNKELCCYKCKSSKRLLVEEKRNAVTNEILETNFICGDCAELGITTCTDSGIKFNEKGEVMDFL